MEKPFCKRVFRNTFCVGIFTRFQLVGVSPPPFPKILFLTGFEVRGWMIQLSWFEELKTGRLGSGISFV